MQSNVIIFSFISAFLSIFYKVQFIMKIYFVEWLHKNLKWEQTTSRATRQSLKALNLRHVFAELSSITVVDMETIDDKIDAWYVGPI